MQSLFLTRYDAFLDVLDRMAAFVVKVTMGVMTIVLILQVFYRYFMNDSLDWGWDVPRVCFIWAVLLSIPLGFRHNAHVGIDLLVNRFAPGTRRAVNSFNWILMLIVSLTITYYACLVADAIWDQMMPGLALSVGWFYVALAISQIHVFLHVLRNLMVGAPRDANRGEE